MSLNPIDRAVLDYLKRNPYSKPREIADSLGFSLVTVRASLYRLRERGLVVRTSKGYMTRASLKTDISRDEDVAQRDQSLESESIKSIKELRERVNDIEKTLQDLTESISKIERELGDMRFIIRSIQETLKISIRKTVSDPLISRLSVEKILSLSEARKYASEGLGSLDRYIESGVAVVVGKFVVSKDLYDLVVSQMPINVEKLNYMSAKEKILIEALINEGHAYIDSEHMIRLVES
ncbi:MAG: winged helix-turn-helix transcriptional regulator [Sulfolobales archaeon]